MTQKGIQAKRAALYVYNMRHGKRFFGDVTPVMRELALAFERLSDGALRIIAVG